MMAPLSQKLEPPANPERFITANQPFGECNRVSPDAAMTLAAGDRLEHHATIFEMNVENYRRRTALEEKRQCGRPARLRRSGPQRCLSQSGNQKTTKNWSATISMIT